MKYLFLFIIVLFTSQCFSKDIEALPDSLKNDNLSNTDRSIDGGIYIKNHPNPFSDRTSIVYYIPENGLVEVKVLNATGKLVKSLVNENQTKGEYAVNFESGNLISGIYFMQLTMNGKVILKKMHIRK